MNADIVLKRMMKNSSPLITSSWLGEDVNSGLNDQIRINSQDNYIRVIHRFVDLSQQISILYQDALHLSQANQFYLGNGLKIWPRSFVFLIEFYRRSKLVYKGNLNNFKTTLRNFSFSNLNFQKNVDQSTKCDECNLNSRRYNH